jgi:hypothetical protein
LAKDVAVVLLIDSALVGELDARRRPEPAPA